jgi:hypothetical protein
MDPNSLVNPLLLWGSIGAIAVAGYTAYKLIKSSIEYERSLKKKLKNERP